MQWHRNELSETQTRGAAMTTKRFWPVLLMVACAVTTPPARAQFAVIDVAALTQLISQLQTLEQQVATARSQLSQAQQEYQAITGNRGMQLLLSGTVRNYLPADWVTVLAAAQGVSSAFPAFSSDVRNGISAQSVLSAGQLSFLATPVSAQVQADRQTSAILQGLSQQALTNASSRFAAIQQLIDAIATARDEKAALDLQTRISAELGMLQNEQTKLQALYQTVQAQELANTQRLHELAVVGHGQFDTRFQPQP
jgi:type IV secretion system protein VirB5